MTAKGAGAIATGTALILLLAAVAFGDVLGGGAGDGGDRADRGSGQAPVPVARRAAAGGAPIPIDATPPGFGTRDRLRVRTVDGDRVLADGRRRPVALRGVSVNALVDYGDTGLEPVAFSPADLDQMAALGLNVMRLAVSWSRLMPAPGELDRDELQRVTTLVREAGARRIYTVISMHSDRYAADLGRGTEFDGAPAWAVETGGADCGDPRPRYYTACAAAAARRFYEGRAVAGRSLQAAYADVVVALSEAGRAAGPGYIGIDALNEPTDPGATDDAAPTSAWRAELADLQRTLVARLRAAGDRGPIWIQPQGPRSTAADRSAALPRLTDPQLVYAPHAYIDVYGTQPSEGTRGRMRAQYAAFAREAATLDAATVVGEFPGAAGGVWDELRREHLLRQRRSGFGGIAWLWKQPAAGYGWGTLAEDGSVRPETDAAATLGGARLLAGGPDVQVASAGDGAVRVTAKAARGQLVDVWLGAQFGAPDRDAMPRLSGARSITARGSWTRRASLGSTTARGTVVRLRLASGSAAATVRPGD